MNRTDRFVLRSRSADTVPLPPCQEQRSSPHVWRRRTPWSAPSRPLTDDFPPTAATEDHARQGSVWVVNRDLGELTIFDARSGKPVSRLRGRGGCARHLHLGAAARRTSRRRRSIKSPPSMSGRWTRIQSMLDRCRITSSRAATDAPFTSAWRRTARGRSAAIRGHRYREQHGRVCDQQCQPARTVARPASFTRWADRVRHPRHR